MGDTARLEELRRRVESDPASIAFATLAEEYRRAGRFDEAVGASRSGLRFHPAYVSARVTLGRGLMELGELGQAERELRLVLHSSPDNLAARRALGDLYQRQSNLPDALEQFEGAAALAPNDHELAEIVQRLQRDVAVLAPAADAASVLPEPAPIGAPGKTRQGAVLQALEKFYRAIIRVRAPGAGSGSAPGHS